MAILKNHSCECESVRLFVYLCQLCNELETCRGRTSPSPSCQLGQTPAPLQPLVGFRVRRWINGCQDENCVVLLRWRRNYGCFWYWSQIAEASSLFTDIFWRNQGLWIQEQSNVFLCHFNSAGFCVHSRANSCLFKARSYFIKLGLLFLKS